jgi:hypothetical protein
LDGKPAPLFTRPQEFGQIESAKRNRPPERIPAYLTKEPKMETVFIDRAGQPIPEQRRLIHSIEHLKRVLRRPGITLERLDFNGYRASPPRTIQAVHSRYIVFEDGAHLTFPRRDEFDSREDFILWGRLAYRIGIADEIQQP